MPTTPPAGIFAHADFTYDGDGKRVKSAMQTNVATTTTYFVGNYYEVTGSVVTKYYYAGSQRIAMRKNGALNYIIGDHLGSTSVVTDAAGVVVSQQQYKAWGETRYASGSEVTRYQYTGQYSYELDFGLQFYNARWYDSSLGRFTSADTIVPGGVQGYDHYAYVNNNPVKYKDPSGHRACGDGEDIDCNGKFTNKKKGGAENLAEMLILANLRYDTIILQGNAIELIKKDPDVIEFQSQIIALAIRKPEFGKSFFEFSVIAEDGITFGGNRSTSDMFLQLLYPDNPKYSGTWEVASNPLTWMLRAAEVSAHAYVYEDEQILISYSLHDVFDLRPDWEHKSVPYNVVTSFSGGIWHEGMGASEPDVYANWSTLIDYDWTITTR